MTRPNPMINKTVPYAEAQRAIKIFAGLSKSLRTGSHAALRKRDDVGADGEALGDLCLWNDGAADVPAWAIENEEKEI